MPARKDVRDIESMRTEVLAVVQMSETVAFVEKGWNRGGGWPIG